MIARIATLRTVSRAGLLTLILICAIALSGWWLGIPVLASIVPGWPRMAPIVMLCFLLCAAATFEFTLPVRHTYLVRARIAAAAIVLGLGVYTLIDYFVTTETSGASAVLNTFGPWLGR